MEVFIWDSVEIVLRNAYLGSGACFKEAKCLWYVRDPNFDSSCNPDPKLQSLSTKHEISRCCSTRCCTTPVENPGQRVLGVAGVGPRAEIWGFRVWVWGFGFEVRGWGPRGIQKAALFGFQFRTWNYSSSALLRL